MAGHPGNPKGANQREQSLNDLYFYANAILITLLPFSQPTKLKPIHLGTVPSTMKNNTRAIGIDTDVYGPTRYVPQAIKKHLTE